jgi:uncharacterized membrane protein YhaH (DUF805 family)
MSDFFRAQTPEPVSGPPAATEELSTRALLLSLQGRATRTDLIAGHLVLVLAVFLAGGAFRLVPAIPMLELGYAVIVVLTTAWCVIAMGVKRMRDVGGPVLVVWVAYGLPIAVDLLLLGGVRVHPALVLVAALVRLVVFGLLFLVPSRED